MHICLFHLSVLFLPGSAETDVSEVRN